MNISLRSFIRTPKILLILTAIFLFISCLLALCMGVVFSSPLAVIHTLWESDASDTLYRIIVYVRLPRILASVLTGAALAVAGALLQATLNNPLAAPNIIGVNSGAGATMLMVCALFPSFSYLAPLAAFIGALTATLLVYFIAVRAGAARLTLILAGVAISSFLGAISDTMITLFPDTQASRISFIIGGFSGITMSQVIFASVMIGIGLISAQLLSFDLNVLILGNEVAHSLGVYVSRVRMLALITAALLAGSAVSLAGLLGFVGLIVPHIARRLIGHDLRILIPMCALSGALLTLLCDLLSRVLFAPFEAPVGIILSFLGAPFFIYLLIREKRHAKA